MKTKDVWIKWWYELCDEIGYNIYSGSEKSMKLEMLFHRCIQKQI
jgi:hypothetical protein